MLFEKSSISVLLFFESNSGITEKYQQTYLKYYQ